MKDIKAVKNELQDIIYGKGSFGKGDLIQAAKAYLRSRAQTGGKIEETKPDRAEEERALKEFAINNGMLLKKEDIGEYITSGAEQKVYFRENSTELLKVNDAVFYIKWSDYLNSLLLHNYFFSDTSYLLVGFIAEGNDFFAVVSQQFVLNTEATNLDTVKAYLLANGFLHKKNNDYYHPQLGIILEDLHDENVLTSNGTLFFIDTVFYLTDSFTVNRSNYE